MLATPSKRLWGDDWRRDQRRTAREYSPGSIYAAIERLEGKGYVERRKGEASAIRGGRAKVHFTVTALGSKALETLGGS